MISDYLPSDCFKLSEPVDTLEYADERSPLIWGEYIPPPYHYSGSCMSFSHWLKALGFYADYKGDGNGNLLFDGEFGYVYKDANQLYEVRERSTSGELVSRYYYNHDGRRIKKVEYEDGQVVNVTYYVGRDFELQNYSGTTYNVTYYMANGELVGRKDNDGSRYYYHNDHLGGTHVVTNSSGGVVERTRYYPYGKLLKGGESKYTFTGQEDDKESNLMYYGGRYYHPEIRRFTQPDPIIQNYYNPQVLNRYSYVNNNPLKYVDPTGHLVTAFGYGHYDDEGNEVWDNSWAYIRISYSIDGGKIEYTEPMSREVFESKWEVASQKAGTLYAYFSKGKCVVPEGVTAEYFVADIDSGYEPDLSQIQNILQNKAVQGILGAGASLYGGVGVAVPVATTFAVGNLDEKEGSGVVTQEDIIIEGAGVIGTAYLGEAIRGRVGPIIPPAIAETKYYRAATELVASAITELGKWWADTSDSQK